MKAPLNFAITSPWIINLAFVLFRIILLYNIDLHVATTRMVIPETSKF